MSNRTSEAVAVAVGGRYPATAMTVKSAASIVASLELNEMQCRPTR